MLVTSEPASRKQKVRRQLRRFSARNVNQMLANSRDQLRLMGGVAKWVNSESDGCFKRLRRKQMQQIWWVLGNTKQIALVTKRTHFKDHKKKHPMHKARWSIAAAHSSRGARTVEVPWQKLESVLTGGVRGPKLSRWFYKGPKKLFLIPRRGLKKFLKGQLSTRLQKLPSFAKSRSNRHGENVATYLVPLTGNPQIQPDVLIEISL